MRFHLPTPLRSGPLGLRDPRPADLAYPAVRFVPLALPGFFAAMGVLNPVRSGSSCRYSRPLNAGPLARTGILPSRHRTFRPFQPPVAVPGTDLVFPQGLPARLHRKCIAPTGQGFARRHLGFATSLQARHDNRPNRVRHYPTDWSFTCSCFPPPLTRTQLLTVTEFRSNSDEDFHLADSTRSEVHRLAVLRRRGVPLPGVIGITSLVVD